MENLVNNKIIRRSGIEKAASYNRIVEDFCAAFNGFSGVSIEQIEATETENASVIIYLDKNKKMSLKIVVDKDDLSFRMSFHIVGSGGEKSYYLDNSGKGDYVPYNIVRTAYGVAFTDFPFSRNSTDSVSDGNFQNYFSTMEDEYGKEINCFIHVSSNKDDTGSHFISISSEQHDSPEKLTVGVQFAGKTANHTVLFNAVSYSLPLVSRHLYKKLQTEEDKYGKIKIAGKTFICGSHYCLECLEE